MKLLFIFFIVCFQFSFGQKDSSIYIKEFGWTLVLPADFKFVDKETVDELLNLGKEELKKATNRNVNTSTRVDLITVSKDSITYFNLSYSTSKSITSKNWQFADSLIKKQMLDLFIKEDAIKPINSNSIVKIDGVKFNQWQVNTVMYDLRIAHLFYLTTFYMNHYISLTYSYTDCDAGDEIFKMLFTSKFEK